MADIDAFLILSCCGHECAHPAAFRMPAYMDVHGHFRHHTEPKTGDAHPWCNQNCKMHGVTGTAMLRPANDDDIKRFFKPLYRYLERSALSRRRNQDRTRVYNAFNSTPKWRDWVANIDTLTEHPKSAFSDGHFARNEDEHWDLKQVAVWPLISQPNQAAPPAWNRELALERGAAVPLPAPAQGAAAAAQALPAFPGYQLVPLAAYPPGYAPPPSFTLQVMLFLLPVLVLPRPLYLLPLQFSLLPQVVSVLPCSFWVVPPQFFTAPAPVFAPPPPAFPPAPPAARSLHATLHPDLTRNDDMTRCLGRLSVDEAGAPIFPIVYRVVALNEAGHTAPFTPLPNARLPKTMIVGVWSQYTDEDLWQPDVGKQMDKQNIGLPYFTQMTVDLSNENAATWERYVRSLRFMSRLIEVTRRLWLEGVDIRYVPSGPLMHALTARDPTDKLWLQIQDAEVILNLTALVGPLQQAPLTNLVSGGKFIWPSPSAMTLTTRKFINAFLYGGDILNAGGRAEAPIRVTDKKLGRRLLEQSYVIKRDFTAEIQEVFMPDCALLGKSASKGFGKRQSDISRFEESWRKTGKSTERGGDPFIPMYLAVPYNDALISVGEVRVFFVNGALVDSLHTVPGREKAQNWEVHRVAYQKTAPLKNIKVLDGRIPSEDPTVDREHRWLGGKTDGTLEAESEIRRFASRIYERLVNIEDAVAGPLSATYRLFVRIDIGIMESEDGPPRLCLNEIQGADCGLWSDDPEVGDAVPNAVVDAFRAGYDKWVNSESNRGSSVMDSVST
ncbi:hypothetical protein BDZ89DRAFT_1127935 [Hymenopellis radicata]|nr:hypothetical protein BDZ89DRAFT_1127935 [Hymenopellis radicata]